LVFTIYDNIITALYEIFIAKHKTAKLIILAQVLIVYAFLIFNSGIFVYAFILYLSGFFCQLADTDKLTNLRFLSKIKSMTKILRTIILILFILMAISTGYYFYDGIYNYPAVAKIEKVFTVSKGERAKDIAFSLTQEGIIGDPYPLLAYLFATGNYKNLKAGQYLVNSKMTGQQIAGLLIKGKTAQIKLTIIEGWDLTEVSQYLESQGLGTEKNFYSIVGNPATSAGQNNLAGGFYNKFSFLKDKPTAASLEGYIFPDTYYVEAGADAEDIVLKILTNLDNKLTPQMRADAKSQNKNIYQILTMASIIEKEVKTLNDKKIVSGILWSRLKIGQPLQADATVLYALQMQSADKVYKRYTEVDSPYNTYKYKGLPFGPISNPGIDSIIAAIYPTQTNYWYYLSKPDGTTVFSKNLAEHNAAKAKYLN